MPEWMQTHLFDALFVLSSCAFTLVSDASLQDFSGGSGWFVVSPPPLPCRPLWLSILPVFRWPAKQKFPGFGFFAG